ncbi:hypothetical protein GH714_023981 [Hevea brasiliensis]|uniref:Uncharacterized protein n=1 Tax=Hevea brasiliensis TaxID=3981 RepID=A0A6A6MYK1_HEVBR|nr:hypothetical protein GH714_023981 [Hevea brasiliensis]
MGSSKPVSNLEERKEDTGLSTLEVTKASNVDIYKKVTKFEPLSLTTEVASMRWEEKEKQMGSLRFKKIPIPPPPADPPQEFKKKMKLMQRMVIVVCRCKRGSSRFKKIPTRPPPADPPQEFKKKIEIDAEGGHSRLSMLKKQKFSSTPVSNLEERKEDTGLLTLEEVMKASNVDINKEVTKFEALLLTIEVASRKWEEKEKQKGSSRSKKILIPPLPDPPQEFRKKIEIDAEDGYSRLSMPKKQTFSSSSKKMKGKMIIKNNKHLEVKIIKPNLEMIFNQ